MSKDKRDEIVGFYKSLHKNKRVSRAEVERLYAMLGDNATELSSKLPINAFTSAATTVNVDRLINELKPIVQKMEGEKYSVIESVETLLNLINTANHDLQELKTSLVRYKFVEFNDTSFMLDGKEVKLGKMKIKDLPKAFDFLSDILDADLMEEVKYIIPHIVNSPYDLKDKELRYLAYSFKEKHINMLTDIISRYTLNMHKLISYNNDASEIYIRMCRDAYRMLSYHELQFTRFFSVVLRIAKALEKLKNTQ